MSVRVYLVAMATLVSLVWLIWETPAPKFLTEDPLSKLESLSD